MDNLGCATRDLKGNSHQAFLVSLDCGESVDLGNEKNA